MVQKILSKITLPEDKEQNGIGLYIRKQKGDEIYLAIATIDETRNITSYVLLDKKNSEFFAQYILDTWSLIDAELAQELH